MNIIDSSVLIAYFRTEERQHRQAVQMLENLNSLAITDYVLLEVANVLLIRENKKIAQKAVDLLSDNCDIEMIRLNSHELKTTIEEFKKQNGKLSFVDISLLVLKNSRKAKIQTFDKSLARS